MVVYQTLKFAGASPRTPTSVRRLTRNALRRKRLRAFLSLRSTDSEHDFDFDSNTKKDVDLAFDSITKYSKYCTTRMHARVRPRVIRISCTRPHAIYSTPYPQIEI